MTTKLNALDTIDAVIIKELDVIINNCNGAPFIKFLLLVTAIEFLGASADQHPFNVNEIEDSKRSRITTKRFRDGLKLLGKKYEKYAKANSNIDLYHDLRCGMVHNLKPTDNRIRLSEKRHQTNGIPENFYEHTDGSIFIILEDFYSDIKNAAIKLIEASDKGKLPNNTKLKATHIQINKTVISNPKSKDINSTESSGGTSSNLTN